MNNNSLKDQLSNQQRILLALKQANAQVSEFEKAKTEPLAIIGIGCRLPGGVDSPQSYWQLLRDGVDAISEVPSTRWKQQYYDPDPEAPGKMYTRYGGFLKQPVDQFDPQFFGISPREAIKLDPQQRLLLEVVWEAIENAGLSANQIRGTNTGVFVGLSTHDYEYQSFSNDLNSIDAYSGLGNAQSIAVGRISYILGLQGPAFQLDTACSSSLVAIHQASHSLRAKECNMALVGGVNLMLSPMPTIFFCKIKALSADGRSKAFDAAADGYARGEGCGIVVLKRLSDAIANGDNILALIRGSAINHDGSSSGLTVPNKRVQQLLIRQALDNAKIDPLDVSYIEAHGTGTSLGDPIEVEALCQALGKDRSRQQPLIIGSAKTNIGHLEAAAGVAGLIKVVLALQHEEIPPHLHFNEPSPQIDWETLPVKIPTTNQPWTRGEKRRIAGLSSFGFSGTNAHVVLEEAPNQFKIKNSRLKIQDIQERPLHLLTLSAKTPEALSQLVTRYQQYLQTNPELGIADICYTANTGRAHFNHRLAAIASTQQELAEKLSSLTQGTEVTGVFRQQLLNSTSVPKVAFLFTGQGSQYVNMGRQLYETQPAFRQAIDQCDQILSSYLEYRLIDILYPSAIEGSLHRLDETAYTQPALFAVEYALAQVWQSWGIEPDVVMGHSVGEYVAATVAGIFSLEDGLKLIATRGRLMQQLPSGGSMVAVMASESQVRTAIAPYSDTVAIAAFNGPVSVVISGATADIKAICHTLEAQSVKTKSLQVSHAFHSPLMAPMLADFEAVASQVTYHRPRCPVISNVTGQRASDEMLTAQYWVNHVRQPVRFADSIATLHQLGIEVFLEIGPKPILLGMGRQCLPDDVGVWLPSLRSGVEEWQQMLLSLGQLYVLLAEVDWSGFDRDYARGKVVLPTYPFQRERYWVEAVSLPLVPTSKSKIQPENHPLLGQKLSLPASKEIRFESRITLDSPAYLEHHRIYGAVVFLGAGYLEMALAAGASVFKSQNLTLEEVNFVNALVLPENNQEKNLHLVLNLESEIASWQIFSLITEDANEPNWILHAYGKITCRKPETPSIVDIATLRAKFNDEETPDFYNKIIDLAYGPLLRNMEQVWQRPGETLSKIKLQEALSIEIEDYVLHPALLDSCFQTMFTLVEETDVSYEAPYIPIGCKSLRIYCRPTTELWTHGQLYPTTNLNPQTLTADVHIYSPDGKLIAEVEGLQAKKTTSQVLFGHKLEALNNLLYEVEWRNKARFGRVSPEYLLSPLNVTQKLHSTLSELDSQSELDSYGEILLKLEELSVDYILQAFLKMGWSYQPGDTFSTESAAQRLAVVQSHRRLFNRLLQMLAEERILQKTQQQWQVLSRLEKANLEEKSKTLLSQYPQAQAELTLLARCASQLSAVLQGTSNPMELVFPQGDLTTATQLYQESPVAKVMNTLVQQAIATALEKIPPERGVRLLEIGAGTGGTTSYILPHLHPNQTEYVFTDIGALFTTKAQDKFRDYPNVRYQTLDIELDPAFQGFKSHQYDVIVAANVLHATTSLNQTLSHVRQLLAPGGILVLLEGTTPLRWLDLIFGLLEGWWKFNDFDLRPDYPLLSASKWKQLLSESGFSQVVTLPETEETSQVLSQQAVVIAQADEIVAQTPSESRGWLILADHSGVAQALATQLRSLGEVCTLVFAGKQYQQVSPEEFTINPHSSEDFRQLVKQIAASSPNWYGVVQCWSLSGTVGENLSSEQLEALSQLGCGTTLSLVQALVKAGLSQPPRLWLVTSGAQPVPQNNPNVSAIAHSSLWGMGKVIALEHREFKCVRIDLDPHQTVEQKASALWAEIWSEDEEDQVALRQRTRYVARLVRRHTKETIDTPLAFREDATYLITGGLGGLGLLVARWMVSKGAKHLVLVGRSGVSDSAQSKLRELEQTGAKVVLAQADVSELESIAQVLSDIKQSLPPLAGVIHSVGVLSDGVLQQQNWSSFVNVMNPKVQGAWHLHQLTQDQPLDFFVLFSSVASLLGSAGQGNHSAANAFLDALAYYRRGMGLPGLSINWGAVSQVGAAAQRQADVLLEKKGMGAITPQQVLDALDLLMSSTSVEVGVVPIQWSAQMPQYAGWPFLADWKEAQASSASQPEFLLQLNKAIKSERRELLVAHVRQQVAQVLGLNPAKPIGLEEGFFDLGMDSLTSVELRNRLQTNLGCSISSTGAFDYPTVGEMVNYLAQVLELDFSEVEEESIKEDNPNEELENLSEDEIALLLAEELNQKK